MATDWSTLSSPNQALFSAHGGQAGFDQRAVAAGGPGFTRDNKSYYKVRDPVTGAEAWREGEPVKRSGGFFNTDLGRILGGPLNELRFKDSPYWKTALAAAGGFARGGPYGALMATGVEAGRLATGGDRGDITFKSGLMDFGQGFASASLPGLLSQTAGLMSPQRPQMRPQANFMAQRGQQAQQRQNLLARLRALMMLRRGGIHAI